MKSLILALFFGLIISLTSNYPVMAQETSGTVINESGEIVSQPQQVEKQSLFARIWDNLKGKATDGVITIVIGFIAGIFTKHGWTLIIKKISQKGIVAMKELSEFGDSGENFFNLLNNRIRDDGTLTENNVKDIIQAGKSLVAEGKDVVVSIIPKK